MRLRANIKNFIGVLDIKVTLEIVIILRILKSRHSKVHVVPHRFKATILIAKRRRKKRKINKDCSTK